MSFEEIMLTVVVILFVLSVFYYFIGAVMRHRWTHQECDVCGPPLEEKARNIQAAGREYAADRGQDEAEATTMNDDIDAQAIQDELDYPDGR